MSDSKGSDLENSFVADEKHPLFVQHTIALQKLHAQRELLKQVLKNAEEVTFQHDKHQDRLDRQYVMRRIIAIREMTKLGLNQLGEES